MNRPGNGSIQRRILTYLQEHPPGWHPTAAAARAVTHSQRVAARRAANASPDLQTTLIVTDPANPATASQHVRLA